jgi:hypothetical protein
MVRCAVMTSRGTSWWRAGCFLALALVGSATRAEAPAELAEQLAAGEFAPARQAIEQSQDVAARDVLFGDLAAAQAAAGARRASIESAGAIRDDQARGNAFANLGDKSTARQGGGVEPDFDSLIELITSTIAPTTWTEVGGAGAIQEFESGVHIDAVGTAHRRLVKDNSDWLKELRQQARTSAAAASSVRAPSGLRKISLTRLEREVQMRQAAGEPLEEDIAYLAGLQRVQYVLVYPESGDIVLAGPAGGWQRDAEGRAVSVDTGRPVVQLNDLICLLRTLRAAPNAPLTCSIDPRAENLADAQAFINSQSGQPLKASARKAWLEGIRSRVGLQDVRFKGIDPRTRVAQVLFEADYRMKLVGIGLEEPVPGVVSYLDSVQLKPGEAAPPMDVLRWWFTMNYNAVVSGADGQAYELRGQGVQVQSENEFLAANGQRQHTGQANDLNQNFANSFTRNFDELAEKYPIYAELQNVFDLALVAAIMETERIPDRVGWHLTCFGNPNEYAIPLGPAPRTVDSVMNHRVIKGRQIVAAVSGGVRLDPFAELKESPIQKDSTGKLGSEHDRVKPADDFAGPWWWD